MKIELREFEDKNIFVQKNASDTLPLYVVIHKSKFY